MRSTLQTSSVSIFSRHIKLKHKRNNFLLALTAHIAYRLIGDAPVTIALVKHFSSKSTRGMTRIMRNGDINVEVLGKLYTTARKGKRDDVLVYLKTLIHELIHVQQHLNDRPFGVTLDDPHYFSNMAEHEAKLSEGFTSEGMGRLLDNFTRMKRALKHEYVLLNCTRK